MTQPVASPQAVARAVDDLLRRARDVLDRVPGGPPALLERRVLLLQRSGTPDLALVLAAHGARVALVDEALAAWSDETQRARLRVLFHRLARHWTELDPAPLRAVLEGRAPDGAHLERARIDTLPAAAFDLVVSVDWLAGRAEPARDAAALARATRPGGIGLHALDVRDRRDRARPLDHLTVGGAAFDALVGRRAGRGRLVHDHERALRVGGFVVDGFMPTALADDDYLDDLVPRLGLRYRGTPRAALRRLAGWLLVERPREEDVSAAARLARSACAVLAPRGPRLQVGRGPRLSGAVRLAPDAVGGAPDLEAGEGAGGRLVRADPGGAWPTRAGRLALAWVHEPRPPGGQAEGWDGWLREVAAGLRPDGWCVLSWDRRENLPPGAGEALAARFGTHAVRAVARVAAAALVAQGAAPAPVPAPARPAAGLLVVASLAPDADARAALDVVVEDEPGARVAGTDDDERVAALAWRAFVVENRARWSGP